jgi:hypothetical protein
VVEVDFSRRHQRTILRWERFDDPAQEVESIFRKTTRSQVIVEKGMPGVFTGQNREGNYRSAG